MTRFQDMLDGYSRRISRSSVWARRLAGFAVPTFVLGLIAHRRGYADSLAALAVYGWSFLFALLAVVLAVSALVSLWVRGGRGFGQAILALIVGGALSAVPVAAGIQIWRLPQINDIATDPDRAPAFVALAARHSAFGAPATYADPQTWFIQLEAYPQVVPLRFDSEFDAILAIVESEVKKSGWTIASVNQVGVKPRTTVIEAIAKTRMFAFEDDVAIRIAESGELIRLDMRSASRFGAHDLGANARRIINFLGRVEAAVRIAARV